MRGIVAWFHVGNQLFRFININLPNRLEWHQLAIFQDKGLILDIYICNLNKKIIKLLILEMFYLLCSM